MLCDICMLYDCIDRTGRSNDTDRTRGSNDLDRAGGPNESTGLEGTAETHRPEGRILASSGVYVVCGILGNSLSIYACSCLLCVSGTSVERGKAPT